MTTSSQTPQKNILVSLETICDNRTALDRLAELAALFNARLHGLYVEDEELLAISELPFTQEIRLYAAAESALERTNLEQQMRSAGKQAESLLAMAAKQWNVAWYFQRVRGKVTTELSKAAEQADIVSMLAGNRSSYRGRFLPREQADIEQLMDRSCIMLPPKIIPGEEIIVVVSRIEELPNLLEPARLSSHQGKRPLVVLLQAGEPGKLQQASIDFLQPHHISPQIFQAPINTPQQLIELINRRSVHTTFVHAANPLLRQGIAQPAARRLHAPIMIIR